MSITIKQYDLKGKEVGTLTLSEALAGVKVSPVLLAQAVRVYLANQRQGTSKVKTRGDVAISTRKIYRQKGTGRARHGAKGAPIFVGGGVAHGPSGNQNYSLSLPQKMRQLALKGALSQKVAEKVCVALTAVDGVEAKTKTLISLFEKIAGYPKTPRVLVVLDKSTTDIIRAGKNLKGITFTQAARLNTYEVLNHDSIVFTAAAIDVLTTQLTKESVSKKPVKKAAAPSEAPKPTKRAVKKEVAE